MGSGRGQVATSLPMSVAEMKYLRGILLSAGGYRHQDGIFYAVGPNMYKCRCKLGCDRMVTRDLVPLIKRWPYVKSSS